MLNFKANLPLCRKYDVIVVGGGPSGYAAAIAAAREGAKTLLIEATGALGGLGTNGLVPFWCGFSNGGAYCNTGIGKKVLMETCKLMDVDGLYEGALAGEENPAAIPWRLGIDAEVLKRVYDELVISSGAEVLFNTILAAVQTDDCGRVSSIVVANKAGLSAYEAKVFVDCTGEADLVAKAGGAYMMGDENGNMQAGTLCFTLSGVDIEAWKNTSRYRIYPCDKEKYPTIIDNHCTTAEIGKHTIGFNAGHLAMVNSIDPVNVSKNLIKGRKLASEIVSRLKEEHSNIYGKAHLEKTAAVLGTREGRIIVGDYTLTEEDYLSRRIFADEIARNCYEFDSHDLHINEKDGKPEYEVAYKGGESHGIPYRCLTPKDLKNVLVAGKSISAQRRVMGSVRIMATCLATGEAAGMAAAHTLQTENCDVHTVNTDKLRARLKAEGAYIL
ncbi:MAG: FAD-dependent oxidoreductase [Clostridia bacterium]|nr:FAD-dependent oxidoreductase [Clostridia bacterium]